MDYLAALLPPAGLCVLFVLLMRSILHADRRERVAAAKARAERRDHPERVSRVDSPS